MAVAIAAAGQATGAVVTLKVTGDALNASSFNAGTNWSDTTAPSAANTYVVSNLNANVYLRTPPDAASYTFAGSSLEFGVAGGMIYKGTGSAAAPNIYTINNLILSGGLIRSGAGSTNVMKLAGNISVTGTGSTIQADQNSYIVDSVITGTGALTTSGNYSITFNGSNTFTGNLTVSTPGTAGTLLGTSLSTTNHWKFAIGANGVNNSIGGTGKLGLNGVFDINLTGASTTVGHSWTLVNVGTLAETFASTFSIAGFTSTGNAGSRIWTHSSGSYQFVESSGILSVISTDSDGDGLADTWEIAHFGNIVDYTGTDDPDGDGANNEAEETAGTDPQLDTSWPDVDIDGLKDAWEIINFGNIAAQGALGDPDGDLATNLQEFLGLTSPKVASDWPDSDSDGMNDAWETAFGLDSSDDGTLHPNQGPGGDLDGDSFTNFEEHEAHTNPNNATLSPIRSALKNRWSFNGALTDSVGGSDATVVDVGANEVTYNSISTPTAINMSGGVRTASDYVKLGTNLLPKSTTPVSIELWAKQNTIQNWGRIFDFHSGTAEYLMMAWTQAANNATDQVETVDGGVASNLPNKNQPYGIIDEYHIVMTLQPLAGSSGRMKVTFYSAKSTATDLGAEKGSFETTINLVNLNDLIDALGYSPWAGDNTASATYSEVRIWNGALFPWVREKLHDQGADNAAIPDSDNDSLPDEWETNYFANISIGTTAGDNDGDTFSNRDEYIAGSNPNSIASVPGDADGDGLADSWEINYFGNITAQDGNGDPDGDLLTNEQEETNGTNPNNGDNDGDGLNDAWEILYFLNTTAQDGTGDPDGDTYNNEAEETGGSNPTVAASIPGDVDGDGLLDAWEITYFTNITAQNGTGDPDLDGYTNEQEETAKSKPNDITSVPGDINGDGFPDGFIFVTADPLGTASFNSGTGWSGAAAPVAGSNYLVPIETLRTPSDANPYTFAGDKLVITTGGSLVVKGTGVITIPYLGLDGGFINNATNANAVITLEGGFHISRTSNLWANNNSIVVNAVVSGTKNLDITRSGVVNNVTFNAANTLTGNLNVTGGFVLGSTGSLAFKPGATGVTNAVIGTGVATFNGGFNIDLGTAGTTAGDNWTLVNASTLAETYGTTFAVNGFTADAGAIGARKWTSGNYQFDEATGVLTRLSGGNDFDTDGMNDAWETTYFGGLDQSATADFDGDGTNNLTEFRLGLIPNSGSSRFAVTRGAGGLIQWTSATGLTFTIQRSTTLLGGWTTLDTIIDTNGSAGATGFTDPSPPAGHAFYRVTLEP